MNYDYLLLHYGELSTKGENRRLFIQCLVHNVRVALKPFGVNVKGDRDHIYVDVSSGDYEPILERLQEVSGIQRISLVYKGSRDLETLKEEALSLIKLEQGKTFKFEVKRSDKRYPLDSYGLSCALGGHILKNTDLTVDVHEPDIRMKVLVRVDAIYLSVKEFPGLGGYPLGMNGKVELLLSGGIDSPVAAYALLRRGIKIECIHFASPPYTSEKVIDKLSDILKKLNLYQSDIKLTVIPFTKIQEAIYRNVDEPYCITMMRRMMVRLAVTLAKRDHCLAIATGESIGQVASQTLESMQTINEVTNFPVLRPLAAMDKLTIIQTAEKIGTFEISIRPYEDCCTIFKPKKPKTKPKIEECRFYEEKFDFAPLLEEALENIERRYFSNGEEVEAKKQ